MKAVDLFSDLRINRWWFHKLSKKIKIDIKEIKLLSTSPRIGSDMISFNKNKIPEKINDVQNCNMYMDDMYDLLSLFSHCTENFINAVSIPYLYTTKAKPINA